jgi:hypothetical protein
MVDGFKIALPESGIVLIKLSYIFVYSVSSENKIMHNSFFIRNNRKFSKILFSDVLYIEAFKKYVFLITKAKKHEIQISLSCVEKLLPGNYFCRISKSHIISLQGISEFDNNTVCIGEKRFILGRSYKKILMERLIVLDKGITIVPSLSDSTIDNLLGKNRVVDL